MSPIARLVLFLVLAVVGFKLIAFVFALTLALALKMLIPVVIIGAILVLMYSLSRGRSLNGGGRTLP